MQGSIVKLLLILFIAFSPSVSADLNSELQQIISSLKKGTPGVSIVDLSNNQEVFGHNSNKALKPASVLKVITAATALRQLGPHFRFETQVLALGNYQGLAENIYIRGGGDPELNLEQLWLLAREIKKLGIKHIRNLHFDRTLFVPTKRSGQRAYQTGTSALAFNYNSIAFYICPAQAGGRATITSDPWEMPVRIIGEIKTVAKGSNKYGVDEVSSASGLAFKASGQVRSGPRCFTVLRSIKEPDRYLALTLRSFLESLDVSIGNIIFSETPTGAILIYAHRSKPLSSIVRDLHHYSNNFIAEQILFSLGTNPAGNLKRELGLRQLGGLVKDLGFAAKQYHFEDASGLDHDNRVSPRILSAVLVDMFHDKVLSAEYLASFPVGGRSGTLEDRVFSTNCKIIRAKTGSLDGVSSLAGYITTRSAKEYAFAIIQNGLSSQARADSFEERVVNAVCDKASPDG